MPPSTPAERGTNRSYRNKNFTISREGGACELHQAEAARMLITQDLERSHQLIDKAVLQFEEK